MNYGDITKQERELARTFLGLIWKTPFSELKPKYIITPAELADILAYYDGWLRECRECMVDDAPAPGGLDIDELRRMFRL